MVLWNLLKFLLNVLICKSGLCNLKNVLCRICRCRKVRCLLRICVSCLMNCWLFYWCLKFCCFVFIVLICWLCCLVVRFWLMFWFVVICLMFVWRFCVVLWLLLLNGKCVIVIVNCGWLLLFFWVSCKSWLMWWWKSGVNLKCRFSRLIGRLICLV